MYLCDARYEEIKQEIVDMYEECALSTFPIDCFEIARRQHYRLIPYSKLPEKKRLAVMQISNDGFSVLGEDKMTGMYTWAIVYNDFQSRERQRWTIMHEIGHIRLDHSQDSELAEAEANFFAKYSIAPPPLVHVARCDDFMDIAAKFEISMQAAYYAMSYYNKWLQYGPAEYVPNERRLLRLFGVAA